MSDSDWAKSKRVESTCLSTVRREQREKRNIENRNGSQATSR